MGWIRGGQIPGGVGQSGNREKDETQGERSRGTSMGEGSAKKQMVTPTSESCEAAVNGH